jgi:hypothetical protein
MMLNGTVRGLPYKQEAGGSSPSPPIETSCKSTKSSIHSPSFEGAGNKQLRAPPSVQDPARCSSAVGPRRNGHASRRRPSAEQQGASARARDFDLLLAQTSAESPSHHWQRARHPNSSQPGSAATSYSPCTSVLTSPPHAYALDENLPGIVELGWRRPMACSCSRLWLDSREYCCVRGSRSS